MAHTCLPQSEVEAAKEDRETEDQREEERQFPGSQGALGPCRRSRYSMHIGTHSRRGVREQSWLHPTMQAGPYIIT